MTDRLRLIQAGQAVERWAYYGPDTHHGRHASHRQYSRRVLRRTRQRLGADARTHFFREQIIRRKLFCRDPLRVGKTAERFQRFAVSLESVRKRVITEVLAPLATDC